MLNVKLDAKPADKDQKIMPRFAIQRRPRTDADWVTGDFKPWNVKKNERGEEVPCKPGETGEVRELQLAPNERLVIEGDDGTIPVSVPGAFAVADIRDTQYYRDGMPTIESLSPTEVALGGEDITLTVTGTGFYELSKIMFNGGEEATTYVSPTSLTTIVKPSVATTEGAFPVTVNNGPLVSEPAMFTFTAGAPAGTSRGMSETPKEKKDREEFEKRQKEEADRLKKQGNPSPGQVGQQPANALNPRGETPRSTGAPVDSKMVKDDSADVKRK